MRVAIGPFPDTAHDRWPVYGAEELAPEFEVIPFGETMPHGADVCVGWSPEYWEFPPTFPTKAYKVAFLGDWHVNVPDLSAYDLIATDYRGTQMLRDRGIPESKIVWWRGYSFDPRIHTPIPLNAPSTRGWPNERPADVAFWGRPDGGKRDLALTRLKEICKRRGWERQIHGRTPYLRGEEANGYRRAKVTWNQSVRSELNMRVFESAACGSLSMLEMDNAELWASNAPLVPWQWSTLEAQLEQWITDDAAREAKVREQQAWVQRNRPVDRLRALCVAIQERMERSGRSGMARGDDVDSGRDNNSRLGYRGSSATALDPTPSEQRLECVALVPPTAKRILDLGANVAGVGWALKKRQDCYVVGVDLDEQVKDIATARCDEFHLFNLTADVEQWRKQPWYQAGTYDAILMLDVIEHVYEPAKLVESAKSLLAPGGVIVASVPQVHNTAILWNLAVGAKWEYFDHANPHREWAGPQDNILAAQHVRFFCKSDLERLFTRAGFTVEKWDASYMSAPGLEKWTHDLSDLIGKYGGDVAGFDAAALVIQWLLVARLT